MFPYVLSPDVLQDLQDIWDFIAADNMPAADKLEDGVLRGIRHAGEAS
jgi:plasmid stabilization system protein ParE